jgi:DNA replication protein
MIEFKGFPARMQFTPVPNLVFSSLLPQITDITELKTLCYVFKIIYGKKGLWRFVSCPEIFNQAAAAGDLKDVSCAALTQALESLVNRKVLLPFQTEKDGATETLYFLNTEPNQINFARVQRGEIQMPEFKVSSPVSPSPPEPSDIFTLYEQNIGMLTPLIADEMREAGKQYPESWIKEAIKEAAALNKRSWRYIDRILEHWSTEGKDDGTHRGHPQKNTDPDKYIRGKYGHMVQR